ncbi:MAG: 8-amino-7-oxononanoate synthase [Pseudomonadota bacterium]
MSALGFLVDELATLELRGERRTLRTVDNLTPPSAIVDGRQVLSFASNDYLGLSVHPALRDAARLSLGAFGVGSASSRLIAGNLQPHRQLENQLAAFHGAPAALLFNSGYHANVGLLSALAGPDDAIFSDANNHASIVDGARLSKAQTKIYGHCDTGALASLLAATQARRRFLVSESLFSMDGTIAPLAELRALADRYHAVLIVDEAHAIGAIGPAGRGAAASTGVRPDILVATLGKSLATFGAYVAGPRTLVDYLINRARSFVFTTALPPTIPAAAMASLALVSSHLGDTLRNTLRQRVNQFTNGLASLGLLARQHTESPIFPVLIGDNAATMHAAQTLLDLGIFAQGIRPPTVAPGTARLRFSLSASHAPEHIDRALDGLSILQRHSLIPQKHRL